MDPSFIFAPGWRQHSILGREFLRLLRAAEPPSPSVVEAVDGEQHIVVRRGQLLALLQSYHHANGMNDEDALRAAKQGLVGMAVPAAPAA
jgi:hypothetical protein